MKGQSIFASFLQPNGLRDSFVRFLSFGELKTIGSQRAERKTRAPPPTEARRAEDLGRTPRRTLSIFTRVVSTHHHECNPVRVWGKKIFIQAGDSSSLEPFDVEECPFQEDAREWACWFVLAFVLVMGLPISPDFRILSGTGF